jgi:hypothetical protein
MGADGSRRWMMPFFVAPALGVLSLVLPVLFSSQPRLEAPLFPLVATGVKHLGVATLALLFLSGVILGGAFSGKASWVASVLVFAAMPIIILAEGIADPMSHTLFPFELVLYGALSLVTLLGAGAGVLVRKLAMRGMLRRAGPMEKVAERRANV